MLGVNGAGNEKLALEAAKISSQSNGTVKFDLKAWNEVLHLLLTGRSNKAVFKNFEKIFKGIQKYFLQQLCWFRTM